MFIRNTKSTSIKLKYKPTNQGVKTATIPAGSILEVPEVTAVSQIIFNSYDQRLRDLNTKFPGRGVEQFMEFREILALSGATL